MVFLLSLMALRYILTPVSQNQFKPVTNRFRPHPKLVHTAQDCPGPRVFFFRTGPYRTESNTDEKMASQTASDVGPGVGIKQLEELSLLQNTEGEKGSDANEPSEKYLAYRCSLLDSIAQDTKFKFDTTLEDTEDYSNGGICAESDMLTDLKLYQSGRRRDEDTFVALYDMSIEEADNIGEIVSIANPSL